MKTGIDKLLDFLKVDYLQKQKGDWNLAAFRNTGFQDAQLNEIASVITGKIFSKYGDQENCSWSFDEEVCASFKRVYIPGAVTEFRNIKYNQNPASTNYVIENLVHELQRKAKLLEESGLRVPKLVKTLQAFIQDLLRQKVPSSKQDNKNLKTRRQVNFNGYQITHSNLPNKKKLIEDLFVLFVQKEIMVEQNRQAFISLFTANWNNDKITWKGNPKEYMAFYAALFHELDNTGEPVIKIHGYKIRLQQLATCIEVFNSKTNFPLNSKELKRYNSHPKANPLYNAIVNKILRYVE